LPAAAPDPDDHRRHGARRGTAGAGHRRRSRESPADRAGRRGRNEPGHDPHFVRGAFGLHAVHSTASRADPRPPRGARIGGMTLRQIVLDTETTGLYPEEGHRIVEIGLVELQGRRRTGRTFHTYLDPERDIDAGAEQVHGLSPERLSGEPKFGAVLDRLLAFVTGAEILIHNAPFDIGFLDAEMKRLGRGSFKTHCAGVVDTLEMAREMRPGQRNSLDVLCGVFGVSNEHRTLHGALLDAELLAEVYLRMTMGQESLAIFGDEGTIA